MRINRRYKHNIKSNLSFYLAIILLTAISIFLFLSILTTGVGLDNYVTEFSKKYNIEDAQFMTLETIEKEDINQYEKDYDLTLEKTGYVDIEEDGYTLRLLHNNAEIDKYEVYEGRDVAKDNEIVISKGFADAHALEIGDSIELANTNYIITGFFLRPDYINCLENLTDAYRNNDSFGLGVILSSEYEKIGEETEYYTVVYGNRDKEISFRKMINDEYTILRYTDASINPRIEAVKTNPKTYMIMSYMMMCLMMIVISVLISTIISRRVKRESRIIGTLKALGYRKKELVFHYATLAFIAGIAGTVVGIIIAILGAQTMAEYYAVDYEPMPIKYTVPVYGAIICIVIPTLFYVSATTLTVSKMLKKNAVDLLLDTKKKKKEIEIFSDNNKVKFRTKFILRNILGNKARTLVVLLGLTVGGYLMALGLTFFDSCDNFVANSINNIGSFQYRYFLNTYMTEKQEYGETYISITLQSKDTDGQFNLNGLKQDSSYIKLKDLNGEVINLEDDKYFLSEMAAKVYGISEGDDFVFYNPIDMKEYTIKISGIVDDCAEKVIYTTDDTVYKLFDLDENVYNVIMADKKLDIDDNIIMTINTKETIKDQIQSIVDDLNQIIIVIIALGIILCIITVYLTVNMIVEENADNISLLKIFGYKKKEISRMVLSVNHILVPISFVFSIPLAVAAGDLFYTMMIDSLSAYIEPIISWKSILICIVLVGASYWVSLCILRRKVLKVDMVQSLKSTRE